MQYTGYELIWLFFAYSFIGWVMETAIAAVKQKRFVNRGLVNAPLCILYGIAAVLITVLGQELQGVWLFIGSAIVATLFEWIAGHLIVKLYHEKWWDYSKSKWNLEGYVCLQATLIWGILSIIMMTWGNGLLIRLFRVIPQIPGRVLIWVLLLILGLDMLASVLAATCKNREIRRWENVDRWITRYTLYLSEKIYSGINRRMQRAYPKAKKVEAPEKVSGIFAYGCSFYKLVWLFVIGSFLGDLTETIFCRITAAVWMSRSSLVWGHFSIVWGFGLVIATLLLYRYRDKSDGVLFLAGTVLGGVYEYSCSVLSEIVLGKVFWDYSHMRFNLGGRINLLYCFFWGIAAVVWIKILYPKVSVLIEKVPMKPGKVISWILIIFMCLNMAVSFMALVRSSERQEGVPALHIWQQILDERFDDEKLYRIYPNAINVTAEYRNKI